LDKYPVLSLVKRHGAAGSVGVTILVALLAGGGAWPLAGWLAIPIAILLGGLAYVLAKCFVELITLITDVLMPE
jgi:hypothetical protein